MSFPGDGDCSREHVARKTLSYPVMRVARYSQADPPLQQLVLLVNTSAANRSIGFTMGFHNHGEGPYYGLLLIESAY